MCSRGEKGRVRAGHYTRKRKETEEDGRKRGKSVKTDKGFRENLVKEEAHVAIDFFEKIE